MVDIWWYAEDRIGIDKPKQSLETVKLGARLKRGTDIGPNAKKTPGENGGKDVPFNDIY